MAFLLSRPGLIVLLAVLLIFSPEILGYAHARLFGGNGCSVVRVIDGDTVRLYCRNEGLRSARLVGFDTPEVYSPDCSAEWWAGTQATWAMRKHLWLADEVTIVLKGEDKYDRLLARMEVDGRNIADHMITAGHARPYNGGRRWSWCG